MPNIYPVYSVTAHNATGEFDCDIQANDLVQLAQYVRETFKYMGGCRDTSEVDCSDITFTYDSVVDDLGEDVTAEAQRIADL